MQDGTNTNAGKQVVSALNSIPFGNIIGGPLAACVHAQAEAAQTTMDFIRGFTMTDSSLDIEGTEPITVTFSFIMGGVPTLMTVPLMTIVPIPYMRINYVDLSFTADITACDSDKMEAKYASEGYKRTEEDEKSISMQSKMGINIRAATSDMPAGMAKMLEFFGNNLIIQETLTAEEVENMRWEAARQRAIREAEFEEQKRIEEERKRERERRRVREQKRREKIADLVQALKYHKEHSEEEWIREQKLKEERERRKKEALERRIRENRPDPNNPFALPETNRKKPHPECTFDPGKSIQWNIERQETLRGDNRRDWLRNHLLLALRTAQRIYPDTLSSDNGQRILKEDLASFSKRYNGWYTYGELNNNKLPKCYLEGGYIDKAYTDFVGYVLDNERKRAAATIAGPSVIDQSGIIGSGIVRPDILDSITDIGGTIDIERPIKVDPLGRIPSGVIDRLTETKETINVERPVRPRVVTRSASSNRIIDGESIRGEKVDKSLKSGKVKSRKKK